MKFSPGNKIMKTYVESRKPFVPKNVLIVVINDVIKLNVIKLSNKVAFCAVFDYCENVIQDQSDQSQA